MIQIRQLCKTFHRTRVLDNIELEIGLGERIALIGSNGAGKTSLIRCLLGEYVHDGVVTIGGLEPRRWRQQVLRRVGFVPQLPPPLKMPVSQLIEYSAILCGTTASRIAALAARLGLDVDACRGQPFMRLSGGMKQKLLIAIALGRDADLLFMDEPAANLDPAARHALFELLAERQERTTMIISSHRLNEVSALVTRVIELDMGKVTLDERMRNTDSLRTMLECRVVTLKRDPSLLELLIAWRFTEVACNDAEFEWRGRIPAADRLRFLGAITPYAAATRSISVGEALDMGGAGV